MPQKIDTIYAFIAVDKGTGDEGITAMRIGNEWVPMVGADKARVKSLRQMAQQIATVTKQKVILAQFKVREDHEVILP